MSFNIDNWKTKKLVNLTIPLKAFFESARKDWHPDQPKIVNLDTMEVEMRCGCEQSIKGVLKDGFIYVSSLQMHGDGSGCFKSYVLDDALRQSSGELEAVLIWEDSSIERLSVRDGVLEETAIDL